MYVGIWLRATVGLVLLVAGVSKTSHPSDFREALENYRLGERLTGPYRSAVVVIIPVAELTAGAILVTGLLPAWVGAVIALPLLGLFTALVFDNARRGIESDCGCGVGGGRTGYPLAWRNLVLFACLVVGLALGGSLTILDEPMSAGVLVPVYVEAVIAAAACLYVPVLIQEMRHQLEHVQ